MSDLLSRSGWRDLRALAWRERRMLAGGLSLMLVNRAAALVLPASAKVVVDQVLSRGRADLLPAIGGAVGLALITESVTGLAMTRVLGVGAQRSVTALRRDLAKHVLRLPVSYFDVTHTGVLVSRIMADGERVQQALGGGLVQLVGGGLTAMVAFVILCVVEWRLALAVMLVLIGAVIVLGRLFGRLDADYRLVSDATATLAARLSDALGAVRVIKAASAERVQASRIACAAHEVQRAVARGLGGASRLTATSALVTGGVGLLMLMVGGHDVIVGRMTLGDLAVFVLLVGALTTPLVQMAAYGSELGGAAAALGRLSALRALPSEVSTDRARRPIGNISGHVAFDRVSYAYAGCRPVLHDISVELPAGSTTALVGHSGAGKSTFCRLLLAFDRPTTGRVLIDGCDLALLRRADYRRQLGVVLQDGALLDGTVAENIQAGRIGATMTEIRRAGRLAQCDEFVDRLPGGYEASVGERGARLSGGQRQRVAIARAILADPRILVLDEATSSLDDESERLVQQALEVLCAGRTTLVIAHRPSTVARADQLLVLDRGRVVAPLTNMGSAVSASPARSSDTTRGCVTRWESAVP